MSAYLKVLQDLQRRQQQLDKTPLSLSPFQTVGLVAGQAAGTAASKASAGSKSKRTTTSTGAIANAGKKAAQLAAFVVNPKSTLSDLEQITGIPANALVVKKDKKGSFTFSDNLARSAQENAAKLFGKSFDDLTHQEKLTALKHGHNPSSRDYGIQYAMVPEEKDSLAKEKYGKLYAALSEFERMQIERAYNRTYSLKGGKGSEIELFQVPQNFQDGYQFGDVVKTIGGSIADLGVNAIQGAGSVVEGVVDWGTYAVADVADFFGGDDFANAARGFGATNYVEQWTGDLEKAVDTHSVFGSTSDAVATGVGQVAAIALSAKLMGKLGLSSTGTAFAGNTINFLSTGGQGMSEAFEAGATPDEARTYGLICGGAALITEKIIGGLGDDAAKAFGKGFLDDKLSSIVNDKVTDIVVQNWVKFGIKGIGEGAEETLEGFIEVLGKKFTYMSEADFGMLLQDANLLEQFIVAAMTSYAAQAPTTHKANKAGVDVDTGLTQDETAVVEGLYAEAIEAETTDGGSKPKKSDQDKIRNEIMEDFQNGTLSPDFIEKTLDPENYRAYTEAKQQQNALQQEYDQLYHMKPMEKTDAQADRQADLKAQLEQSKKQLQEITEKLRSNVKSRIQNSRLLESYNERTRSGQAFKADLSQYKSEAAQKTVQNIMDANVINNTNRTRKFVDFLAKISEEKGIVFSVTDAKRLKDTGFAIQDATVNGYFTEDGIAINISSCDATVNGYFTEDGIAINISSSKVFNTIVGHELTHALEGSKLYDALKDVVVEYAKTTGDYNSHIAALKQIYSGKKGYETDLDAKAERELVADLCGDYLFSDTDFISRLSVKNRNLFQKIYDEVKYLAKLATSGSKEARQLEKVKHLFEQVYRDTKNTAQQTDGARYSLGEYSETQKNNWSKSSKIIIYENDAQLLEFIQDSIANKNVSKKMYFGVITGPLADRIRADTGLDFEGKNAVLRANNVRKILLHDHGNVETESKRGQIAVTENDFLAIKDIFGDPDTIKNEPQGYKGKPAATLEKVIGAKKYTMFVVDSGGSLDIFVQTMYIHKEKGSIANVANAKALTSTSETPVGTAPMYSVSQKNTDVNAKLSLSENLEGNVPAGDQTYGQDVEIDLYDDPEAEEAWDADTDGETDVQGIDAEIEQHLATSMETSRKMDAAAEAGDMEQYRTYKAMYNSLEERIRFLYQQKADANAKLGKAFTNAPAETAQPVRSVAPTREDIARMEAEKTEKARQEARRIAPTREDIARLEQEQAKPAPATDNNQPAVQEPYRIADKNETQQRSDREIITVQDRNAAKLENTENELAQNIHLRQEAYDAYNQQIDRLQKKYDAKKNKNTGVANSLLRQIKRTERLRNNVDVAFEKRIHDLQASVDRMDSPEFSRATQRQEKQDAYQAWAENLVGDTSTWVDKKTGLGYMTNTLRRNLRAIVKDANGNPDYQKADAIYDALAGTYNRNEAVLNRELTELREKYADLKITKAEDAYIQMLGEFRSNPSTTITEDVIKDYYEKHKKQIDSQKVDKVIEMARQDYDQLIRRVNEVLREQGMKEIPYRQGYFPHFTEEKQGPLARLLNWKKKNNDIPTDIAGLTEEFEPVRSYQSFNKKRETDITDYSFTKGFDAYSFGALDWIYHIEDIQKRRALENYIRYIHSEEGVKAKINAIKANEHFDADEAQAQIDLVFQEARNPLNNFVVDLRRGTQTLAGKKSSLDRDMEYSTNRRIYSTMTNISNRVSGNMVAGSVSAAMTNFIPITQSWAQVKMKSSLGAMAETIASTVRDDGTIEKSAFLTNRLRKAENLNKTGWDKVSDKISWLMNAVDSFTSQTVWRSKYNENISSGMSEAEAIHDADLFAEGVLAGRSRGNMPTLFDSKNPLIKMATAFQLEVANQYGYLFKDVPQALYENGQNSKAKLIAHGTKKYLEVFFGAYAFNALYSALTGRNAAFDPVSILKDLLKDMGIGAENEEEEKEISEILGNLADNVLEEVPFFGGFVGGGRIPISSALPYGNIMETVLGSIRDVEEGDWGNLTKEWLNPVYYGILPMGGGQLKKTVEGASMFVGDKPVTGSYTTDGKLRYEVKPDWQNVLQALTFGQWANQNAQDYIDKGYKPLSDDQLTEFTQSGIPYGNYRNYITELSKLQRLSEKADYIASLPISTDQKNLLINNRSGRKDKIDMEDYGEYGSFAEFDFAENNIMKYRFLQDRGISYREYTESKAEYDFAYENPEKYDFLEANGVGYYDYALEDQEFRDAWSWAFEYQEKYAVSKAVTGDVVQYRKYTADLYDIRADKDANGKSISGTAKKKKLAYINSLDLDYGAKIILFKSLYPSDNRYNEDIIQYLKSQENITAAELRTILKELNFIITADGRIGWEN